MRLQQIDVIRGLAALSVAASHVSQSVSDTFLSALLRAWDVVFATTFWANQGLHPGVVVFIVLSGFCIHLPVAGRPGLPDAAGFWKVYCKRRAIRIGPVFLLGCLLGALATGSLNIAASTSAIVAGAFAPIGFVPGNHILDTVIVEAWLYVTYPFTLGIYRRFGARALLAIAALIHMLPVAFVLAGADPVWAQRSWYAFYLYWVIGVLAVEAFVGQKHLSLGWTGAAFVLYIALSTTIHLKGSHYPKSLLLAVCAAMLLVSWRGKNRFPRMWLMLGEASYSLYVVHFPIILLWVATIGTRGPSNQVLLILSIAAAATLAFVFVERPAHRLAQSFRKSGLKPSDSP